MIEIKKHIGQGFGKGELYDILVQLQTFMAGIQGEVYFVDEKTGSDSGDIDKGKSWETAYKTISFAASVSNTRIASGNKSGHRNTIFCRGVFTEDITNFGEKVDLIGVGSADAITKARLIGTHAITSYNGNGTRFFNFEFWPSAATYIFSWSDCFGIEFHDCWFTNTVTYDTDYAVVLDGTTCQSFIIDNCNFRVSTANKPFDECAIFLDTNYIRMLRITNNYNEGDIGIDVNTTEIWDGVIDNNIIKAVTLCIKDDSNDMVITRNMLISDADSTDRKSVV